MFHYVSLLYFSEKHLRKHAFWKNESDRTRISSASRYAAYSEHAASYLSMLKGLIISCCDYRAAAVLRERTNLECIDGIHVHTPNRKSE